MLTLAIYKNICYVWLVIEFSCATLAKADPLLTSVTKQNKICADLCSVQQFKDIEVVHLRWLVYCCLVSHNAEL